MDKQKQLQQSLAEILKNETKLLPINPPIGELKELVKDWAIIDDDLTGKYDEALVYQLEDSVVKNTILLKDIPIAEEERERIIEGLSKGEESAREDLKELTQEHELELTLER
jgi:hypothetical protein